MELYFLLAPDAGMVDEGGKEPRGYSLVRNRLGYRDTGTTFGDSLILRL